MRKDIQQVAARRWRGVIRAAGRALAFIVIVSLGVAVAKVAQNAAIDQFGARLGFDLASYLGVVPVLLVYLWIAHRFRRRGGTGSAHG